MGTKGLFPENEVIKLMRNIVDALAFLESRGIRYGDVHDVNIYYDKLSKVFKLLNPHNIQATGYDLTHRGQRFSFLSPELLLALSEEKNAVDLNVLQKSDLFALGILLIEVCTLKSSSELYDPETYNILDGGILFIMQLYRID
jgi:serine/threonine protein kinase